MNTCTASIVCLKYAEKRVIVKSGIEIHYNMVEVYW